MEKAKSAVSSFLSKDGKHDTTVHEKVNPAVQQEHVTPTRHENVTTAVDKEVHQDHYHTSVQPVHDREVLPEKHEHQVAGVKHTTHHHGDHDAVKQKHAAEEAQFKNTREVGATQETHSVKPTVGGEHVHHHVHENIQPVIQKETVQPHVVHTTVPVHETHHHEPKHHAASALPAVSMDQFKSQGGALNGRGEKSDAFSGQPLPIGEKTVAGHPNIGGHGAQGTTHLTQRGETTSATGGVATGATGASSTRTANGSGLTDRTTHNGNGVGGIAAGTGATGGTHNAHNGSTTTHKKPSLMDKINPKIDADGDGKAGFMK
ncbi:hypothetical protein EJ05DRAFT_230252 [Pseudovirgaria hyperparasitica]|uniref:Allergen n=1 Tax=Pseudovirgaria hyperparasitica TaxID=470096 RepID=A0A6A6VS89_9PEZI|nr:uncharacterized protein EJ05DRAFT_230252 [Pseudovirgaria hyperparasitica]KAF2753015.1 hypothetical protein EJ05DRAFT_230252 [Pseudovirgaria hyperparasitica]